MAAEMKSPRLQLRWQKSEVHGEYLCHYELVLPLRESDIRREVYDDAGEEIGKRSELVIPIKEPTRRTGNHVPCRSLSGEGPYYDTPYRDGAHAKWDAEHLGNLPIYCVTLDGQYLTEQS